MKISRLETLSLLFLVQSIFSEPTSLETLKLVQVITRHGQRTPDIPYPTDPYNAQDFWKEGWGQLTNVGKNQAYSLGQYLKSRYQGFLSDNFVPEEIHALSSDMDRTIISAQLCLAGLFSTENGTDWNPHLQWQPIPLHTISFPNDNLLVDEKACPRYWQELDIFVANDPDFTKITADNKALFEYLSINTGIPITNILQFKTFCNTLMTEEELGLEIPEWAKKVIHEPNFRFLDNYSTDALTSTPQLKRLRAGPLVKYLIDNIRTKVSNSSVKTKLFLLSGHDTTLVNILNTLQVLDRQRPDFSSAFILELHKEDPLSEDYFIKILFRNETGREPYQLAIPGCEFNCPLDTFLTFTEPIIPVDWDLECQLNILEKTSISEIIAVLPTTIAIMSIVIFLISVVYKSRNKQGSSKNEYHPV